jgi:hypothetical protein
MQKQEAKARNEQSQAAQGMLQQYMTGPGAALSQVDPQAANAAAVQLAADPTSIDSVLANLEQRRTAIPGQASQQEQQAFQNLNTATNELQADYTKAFGDLGATQDAYRRGLAAFEGGSQADALAGLYSFFQTMEPGGRITDNEQGAFEGHGGFANQIAGMMNRIKGEGLTAKTRAEFASALGGLYKPRYDRGKRQLTTFEQRIANMQARGIGVQRSDVVGSEGIDFDFGVQTPNIRSGKLAPGVEVDPETGDPELPPGFTSTNPNPEKPERKRSVREQRGRSR